MSEYIKISDVIKICKHLYSSFVTTAFFDTHVLAFENLLRTVAVEFPEPPESKEYCMSGWISVKDRLPEKSGIYLVYGNRGNGKTAIDTADEILERVDEKIKEKESENNFNDTDIDADVQPVKHGWWITKAEDYYKAWQDSGRSWDDMPYFITGKHIACSECFTEYDVCTEGIEHWIGCPCCLAKMDGDAE